MKISMTTTYLDNVKPGQDARLDVFDAMTPGLCLRVTKDKKSWSFVYTAPGTGTRARLGMGTYPGTPLIIARQRATEARGLVEAGTDPRHAAAAIEAPKSIAQLIEERLALKVRGKQRRAKDAEWRYAKYITPLIGKVPVKDFRIDPHYNRVIDPLVKRGKNRMAGVIYQDLNGLFSFAIQRGVVEFSRMAQVESPDKYVPRKRFLSSDEIKTLWASLPTALPNSTVARQIVMLLLATGQRLQEVVGISVQEIDLKKAIWTIPAARAKNGCRHTLPLNALALKLLRETMRSCNGAYLFPDKTGKAPRNGSNLDTTIAEARAAGRFGVSDWKPHDLRRTMATHMAQLGVPELHISHCLNHTTGTKSGVTAMVYNQYDYESEKREALDKWGSFLADLVGAETGLRVVA